MSGLPTSGFLYIFIFCHSVPFLDKCNKNYKKKQWENKPELGAPHHEEDLATEHLVSEWDLWMGRRCMKAMKAFLEESLQY